MADIGTGSLSGTIYKNFFLTYQDKVKGQESGGAGSLERYIGFPHVFSLRKSINYTITQSPTGTGEIRNDHYFKLPVVVDFQCAMAWRLMPTIGDIIGNAEDMLQGLNPFGDLADGIRSIAMSPLEALELFEQAADGGTPFSVYMGFVEMKKMDCLVESIDAEENDFDSLRLNVRLRQIGQVPENTQNANIEKKIAKQEK